MTETERELDLQLGDLRFENEQLRRRLEAAVGEALNLRHKLEHIHALTTLALDKYEQQHESQ